MPGWAHLLIKAEGFFSGRKWERVDDVLGVGMGVILLPDLRVSTGGGGGGQFWGRARGGVRLVRLVSAAPSYGCTEELRVGDESGA